MAEDYIRIPYNQISSIRPDDLDSTNALEAGFDNYVPTYDHATGTFTWASSSAGVSNIEDLGDVNFASGTPTDGQVLTYDSGSGKWVAEDSTGGISASDVDDFTIKYESNKLKIADRIELNIMLNAFRIAVNGSLSQFAMTDGIVDEFEDETGVDTVNSTGESYDSADDYYKPTPGIEIDYMEYANDANAQTAYVTDGNVEAIRESQTAVTSNRSIGKVGGVKYEYAQSFILTSDIELTKIAIDLSATTGAPGNATIRIETDSAGKPSGTLVHANATKTQALSASQYNDVNYTDFILSAGTYHIVWRHTVTVDNNYWTWDYSNASGYGGVMNRSNDGGAWSTIAGQDFCFKVYGKVANLQCYSESTIKEQGSYSLKSIAKITNSLNKTLTKSGLSIDLSGIDTLNFKVYASRTGTNLQMQIHDSGGTTSTKDIAISSANTWETTTWDISGIADANKDDIDSIIIKIINADAENTFYVDDFVTASQNIVLISNSFTAEAVPSDARIVLFEQDVDAITLGTHIKAYISRDAGTTWTEVTLADEGDYANNCRILTGLADISGQPSNTSMEWKVTSHSNKALKLYGVAILWN